MSALTLKGATVPDILLNLENCTRWGARFVAPSEEATFYPYQDVLRRAQKSAAALQALGLKRGDRVALILSTSIEFFDALLGVQLAGGIPAALYPPFRLGKLDEYFTRLRKMLTKIGARYLITESRIRKLLGPGVVGVPSLKEVIEVKDLQSGGGRWQPVDVDPDQPAFLQFSSGTTVEPKAVMVTHTNLLANLTMMQQCLVYRGEDEIDNGCVCWLPLYHDMGLVGCLYLGMYYPGTVTYMGPDTFLAKPAIWLRTLSRYKSAISPAPHFAYSLCATKIKDEEMEGVDLSRWRAALNGAEPIESDGVQRFTERFARWGFKPEAMTPVYGLAEAGLGVTFTGLDDLPRFTEFIDLQSLQSSLFFETAEEIYARVFRELKPRTPVPVLRVDFCRFANADSFIRLEDGRLHVRISDLLEGAPAPVTEALAYILLGKLYRKPVARLYSHRYRLYLNRKDVRRQAQLVRQVRGRKFISGPAGDLHNLEEIFERLNGQHFDGLLGRPLLGWSRRASRSLLGHFDPSHNAIIINRIFDRRETPLRALEYVMFHEMLHLRYPVDHNGSRRRVHTKEFREAERRFPGLKEAKEMLKRL